MFNIFSLKGNANQNDIEVPSHSSERQSSRKQTIINVSEDVEKKEPL
jgi:hypothetical protein